MCGRVLDATSSYLLLKTRDGYKGHSHTNMNVQKGSVPLGGQRSIKTCTVLQCGTLQLFNTSNSPFQYNFKNDVHWQPRQFRDHGDGNINTHTNIPVLNVHHLWYITTLFLYSTIKCYVGFSVVIIHTIVKAYFKKYFKKHKHEIKYAPFIVMNIMKNMLILS